MNQKGQCLCGGVKFEADVNDFGIHACHCTMCRTWSSSPLFAVGVASITFEDEANISAYASSDWAERGFCKQCGTSLFYRLKETNHHIVCCGLFEDQSQFKLEGEIFVDENPGGYAFAGEHPRLTGEEFMASLQQDN